MKITIEPHNPAWIAEFERIRPDLQRIFIDGSVLSIEHVGSTSIPCLLAKPILDIDIIVTSENLPRVSATLIKAGYTSLGDKGVPLRFAFRQPNFQENSSGGLEGEMRRNTYVVVDGCIALRNHLDLKRLLLEDEGLRDEYGGVKLELTKNGARSMGEYCRGKNKVLLKILGKAGWNDADLKEVRRANSLWWKAWRMGVSYLRKNILALAILFLATWWLGRNIYRVLEAI